MPLLAPEVLNSTVQALASCTQIPPRHWRALFQLLNDTLQDLTTTQPSSLTSSGINCSTLPKESSDPSDWTADTMKSLGPLLLLDDSAVRSLRFKSWLKETLSDLLDSLPNSTEVRRISSAGAWGPVSASPSPHWTHFPAAPGHNNRVAVQSVGQVQCPLAVTELLKQRAVAVFGEPQGWTEAQVNSLGNIMAGLSLSEFPSLSPSALSFLSPTSIPLIPPDRLAALSTSQLKALGPDNAAMVTAAQMVVLGEAQRAALGNALGVAYNRVAYDRAEPTTNPPSNLPQRSGASMLGTLGVEVFMQPFLFLLLGIMLERDV
ncbi:hypothetical protein J4Q44_G00025380 [Coregonus suidteri]|uniref:Uncharacterized protein n=1 Tax=Coregonus suidteri TaxID=861788 RepID=A0AAN8M9V1_9TELE